MSVIRRAAALLAVGALVVAACGGDDDGGTATTGADGGAGGEVDAALSGFAFDPEVVEVPVGGTVTWTNMDGTRHTVTAGSPGEESDAFEELSLDAEASGSLTFPEAGSFAFFCEIHPSMRVTVEVG